MAFISFTSRMKKALPIFLSALILFSAFNLNIMSHYCGGKLVETKFILGIGKASCGMEDDLSLCKNYHGTAFEKNCCEDAWFQISVKDSYKVPDFGFELSNILFLFSAVSNCGLMESSLTASSHFCRYKSPPDSQAVSLPFLQVFLV